MKTVVVILLAAFASQVVGAPPPIPGNILGMLKEHLGSWETSGYTRDEKGTTPVKATWSCRGVSGGPGLLCTWHHEWMDRPPDVEEEIIGFDRESGKLRFTRVHPDGSVQSILVDATGKSMDRRWEFQRDGQTAVGNNHIDVVAPGHWEQRMTIEVGGKQTWEMVLTQRRVTQ